MNRVGTIAREQAEKVISVSALYKNTRASRAVQTIMNRDHCDCRIVHGIVAIRAITASEIYITCMGTTTTVLAAG